MILFAVLWVIFVVLILSAGRINMLQIYLILFSGFTVFYPIYKSWRQRHGK